MVCDAMDLSAYFVRVGYEGSAEVNRQTLAALLRLHIQAIPFENLDVLLGRRIDIAPGAVFEKLVTQKRGGYCFGQNTLLLSVLEEIGFDVVPFLGRIRRNIAADQRTGLTHMLLQVTIDGTPWLVDGGFSLCSPDPLRLDVEGEQKTVMEARRIDRRGDAFFHQIRFGDTWEDLYEFRPEPASAADFEIGNWYSCSHPQAHFTNNLLVSRADGTERLIVLNREFTTRRLDGSAVKSKVESPQALKTLLRDRFGLEVPDGTVISAPALQW
jgi:N-hydroxyarylamine O-acetyltransferase